MNKIYNLKEIYKYKDNDDKSEDLLSFLINTVGDNMQLDNSKQAEYLEDIRDIGMQIVFKEISRQQVYNAFAKYTKYLRDDIKIQYLSTLKEVINELEKQSPDDILFKMGQYTKKIEYDDEPLGMRMYAEL